MELINIKNLHASVNNQPILKGVTLSIPEGEVHAIMGPNGSGKSTLANIIVGRPGYEITGTITYDGRDLFSISPEERATYGIFLAFQYPVEIPGVTTVTFLKTALNSQRKSRGESELGTMQTLAIMQEKARQLSIDDGILKRPLNVGFSGGEKKRIEILQMAILEPRFVVLDEIDSGLDIDALRIVANGINTLRSTHRSFLIITHYKRILEYITPDYIHILASGCIVRTGTKALALELEEKGYTTFAAI